MLKRPKTELRSMELRVIEKEDDEISIEIAGEDHTFMNVLKGTLLEHEGVAAATYDVNPEQSGGQTEPILTIKTEGDAEPLTALEDAAGDLKDKTSAFQDAYDAAV
jgi:DNA-directed RNA polymerase subunit L